MNEQLTSKHGTETLDGFIKHLKVRRTEMPRQT